MRSRGCSELAKRSSDLESLPGKKIKTTADCTGIPTFSQAKSIIKQTVMFEVEEDHQRTDFAVNVNAIANNEAPGKTSVNDAGVAQPVVFRALIGYVGF